MCTTLETNPSHVPRRVNGNGAGTRIASNDILLIRCLHQLPLVGSNGFESVACLEQELGVSGGRPKTLNIGDTSLRVESISERRTHQSFVKQVRIAGDEAQLTYTLPVLPQGKDHETVEVLDSVHCSGSQWWVTVVGHSGGPQWWATVVGHSV
jgi:hypothetical protein